MLGHHLSLLVFICLQIKTMVADDKCKADLHFLLDVSDLNGKTDAQQKQVDFVKDFIKKSYIDPHHKLIGLSSFGSAHHSGFNMGDFKNRYRLVPAIDRARKDLGWENTNPDWQKGLKNREKDFLPIHGGRPGVKNILIVITNGRTNGNKGFNEANVLKTTHGITILGVLLDPVTNKRGFIENIPSDGDEGTVDETILSEAVTDLIEKQCKYADTKDDIKAVKEALKKTDDNKDLIAALKKIDITFKNEETAGVNLMRTKLKDKEFDLEDIVKARREILVARVDRAVLEGKQQDMANALEEMGYDLFKSVADIAKRQERMKTYLKQRQIPKVDGKDIDGAYRKVMVDMVAKGAQGSDTKLLAPSLRALDYNIFKDCGNCGDMVSNLKAVLSNVGESKFNEKAIDQAFLDNIKTARDTVPVNKAKVQAALEIMGIYSFKFEVVWENLKTVVEFNRDNLKAALIRDRVDRVNEEITNYKTNKGGKYLLSDALKLLDIEVLFIENMFDTLEKLKAAKPHNEPLTLADMKEAYQEAIIHEVNVAVDDDDADALAAALKKLDDELNLGIAPIEDIKGILAALEARKHEKGLNAVLDLKDILAIVKPPTTEPPVDTTILIIAIVAAFAVVALVIGAVIYCVLKRRREAVEREAALEAAAEEEEEARLEQEAAEEEERRAKEEAEKKAGWGLGAVFGSSATVNTQPSGVPSGSSRRKSSLKTAQDTASPESSSDAAPAKSYISAGRKSSKKSNLSAARRKSSVARKGSQI